MHGPWNSDHPTFIYNKSTHPKSFSRSFLVPGPPQASAATRCSKTPTNSQACRYHNTRTLSVTCPFHRGVGYGHCIWSSGIGCQGWLLLVTVGYSRRRYFPIHLELVLFVSYSPIDSQTTSPQMWAHLNDTIRYNIDPRRARVCQFNHTTSNLPLTISQHPYQFSLHNYFFLGVGYGHFIR